MVNGHLWEFENNCGEKREPCQTLSSRGAYPTQVRAHTSLEASKGQNAAQTNTSGTDPHIPQKTTIADGNAWTAITEGKNNYENA